VPPERRAVTPEMKPKPPSEPVRRTLDYYDTHADEFIARTADVDMSHVYEPFLALVPQGGHILDAGCGSGRDSAEFVRRGYHVTAFDGSAQLARRAAQRTGFPVLHLTFDQVAWRQAFDGVWACGSLLHLPLPEVQDALLALANALRPGGVLFCSLKAGTCEGEREGRWFTDTSPQALRSMLSGVPGLEVVRIWQTDDARPDRVGTRWVNALARRV
jgi:SAM-dependent methyltransferase